MTPRAAATSADGSADLRAGALAGLAGGVAYLAEMALDLALTGRNVDDLLFLGRPLSRDPHGARRLGLALHAGNSAALGVLYARYGRGRLPGRGWLAGVLYASVENAVLYPLTAFDRLHPGVRDRQLDRYWTRPAFLLSVVRHVAYGAALGAAYDRLRR